jgi:DNA-binding NtrC family response regulator
MPFSVAATRLLIVDDNQGVRDFCVKAAQKLGYSVVSAGGGKEALAALGNDPAISLMLTDIVQPGGMNGIELAAAARRARPGLKIVFMSGFVDGRIAGRNAMPPDAILLAKPFHVGELSEALAQAFADAPARERHAVSAP